MLVWRMVVVMVVVLQAAGNDRLELVGLGHLLKLLILYAIGSGCSERQD